MPGYGGVMNCGIPATDHSGMHGTLHVAWNRLRFIVYLWMRNLNTVNAWEFVEPPVNGGLPCSLWG